MFQTFYMVKMPRPLARKLMTVKKVKGEVNDLRMEVPVPDFSRESYEFFYFGFIQFLEDAVGKQLTSEYLRQCKVYQIVKRGDKIIDKKRVT